MMRWLSHGGRICCLALAILFIALAVQPIGAQGQETVATAVWPRALGWDGTYLWIANGFDSTVLRFNEGSDKLVDSLPGIRVGSVTDSMPDAIAPDTFHHTAWVAGFNDFSLTVVDSTGKVQQTITGLAGHPVALAYAKTFMWVVEQNANNTGQDGLVQYDTTAFKALNTIKVGKFPTAIVPSLSPTYIATPGSLPTNENLLWVANGGDDTITMIDITDPSKPKTATFSNGIPAFPIALAFDSANLWVGNYQNQVVKIDGLTGKPLPLAVPITGRLANVAYQDGHALLITGDDATTIDMDSQAGTETGSNVRLQAVSQNVNSYAGAVLVTYHFVYVADWLNDRVVRFPVPQQIASVPTNTPGPTAVPTAAAT